MFPVEIRPEKISAANSAYAKVFCRQHNAEEPVSIRCSTQDFLRISRPQSRRAVAKKNVPDEMTKIKLKNL